MTVLLQADGLHKAYSRTPVIKGVTFAIDEGETFAIIGPNGAGKTTLFKLLTGEIFPDQGRVVYAGADVTALRNYKRANLGMVRTFQVARVFLNFTALGNVVAAIEARCRASGRGGPPWYALRPSAVIREEAEHWVDNVGLADSRHVEAQFLSHGDKKRLELALAIAMRPRVLLMDEPTAGMSPSDRGATITLMRRIVEDHKLTVLITEHDMDVVFQLAHRIMVVNYGEVIAMGSREQIRGNALVREVYLGKEMTDA